MKKNKIMKSKKDGSTSSSYYETADFSEVMKTSKKKNYAPMTETYLAERAAKGSREKFLDIMSRVPDTPPDTRDKIVN